MVQRVSGWLSEPVMGFVALIALALVVAPLALDIPQPVERALDALDWPIVAVFAAEYICKFLLAPSKRAFVVNPWHLLDLFIVVAPFIALLPAVTDSLRSAPVLRLLRLLRLAVLGARSSGAFVRQSRSTGAGARIAPLELHGVVESVGDIVSSMNWDEFVRRIEDPSQEWFHLTGVHQDDIPRLSSILGVPALHLSGKLTETTFPRIDVLGQHAVLFAWYPEVEQRLSTTILPVRRVGTLIVASPRNLVTMSCEKSDFHAPVGRILPLTDPSAPFLVRIMFATLKHLLQRYADIVLQDLVQHLHRLQCSPIQDSTPEFFQQAFLLKREIVAIRGDVSNLREILRAVSEQRVVLRGFESTHGEMFRLLVNEADDLYQTIVGLSEDLVSLIELHMNIASFEMNKVMRLLTLVTSLAVIPSILFGFLSLNIDGKPWPLSVSHVAYVVAVTSGLCLYIFAVKGWLR